MSNGTERPLAAIGVNFSFFSDGLVAETWASTEKSDAFLEDLMRAATINYGLAYTSATVRKRQYIGEVNVRFDSSLGNLKPQITRFCEMLNRLFTQTRSDQI
jgi:hypothetical protein